MDSLKPPKELSLESTSNLSETWKMWKQDFKIFLQATEADNKSNLVKSSILLHCIGKPCREVYNTFPFGENENMDYDVIIAKFDEHFAPRKNLTFIRFTFLTARQQEDEKFDEYYTRLRKLSENCEFQNLRDSLIKDLIIIGIRDKRIQEKLLRVNDITLEQVLDNCRAFEASKIQTKFLQKADSNSSQHTADHSGININQVKTSQNKDDHIHKCKFCSGSHPRGSCPAYSRTCNKCFKKGHFAKCCTTHAQKPHQKKPSYNRSPHHKKGNKKVDVLTNEPESSDEFFIGTIDSSESTNEWNINLITNGTQINYKIDSGAQANILPYTYYQRLKNRPKLHKSNSKLSAYSGAQIKVVGKCVAFVQHKEQSIPILFIVADTTSSPILGLKSSTRLNLIQRIHEINKDVPDYALHFEDCFGELGTLQEKYHIYTDDSVPPVIDACRKVPIALLEKLQVELKRMQDLNIITPVTEPTDWVSSLVVVQKPNGSLRICLDPRNLNKAIKRHHHKLPTTEEILSKMSNAKYFTKLDASNAYWQIPLDDESSRLLTFNSPYGRYRFLRMPFGIHSASEICQVRIAHIIEHVEGAINSQDDIIIWGSTKSQLKDRTVACLESIRKSGLKLRRDKCQFEMCELNYLGHTISADGIEPDFEKIAAILEIQYPKNVKELQRFLGMINYLGKFIPNLSEVAAPLRKLLEKDIHWSFDQPQINSVEKLKQLITTSPILKYFNPNLPIKVSSDASKEGLGAVLEQYHETGWHPVAFASRSLTSSEANYCPFELETLSIVFACEKFREYLYGQQFEICNDHQPLKSIFNKPLSKAPARIQRFLLRLQRYNFNVNYVQGKHMHVADTLSRAAINDNTPEIPENELNTYIHSVITNLPISERRMEQFQSETSKDDNLQELSKQIAKGWPTNRNSVHPSVSPFFTYKEELSLNHGLLLKGNRIIVPTNLRKDMLNTLHIGHPGIEKMKSRARQTLFWPNIDKQLEDVVASCGVCQEHRNKQPKEPLMHHDIPQAPWTKVGTDLFHLQNKHYVIIVDYTSKYFDLSRLPDTRSSTVITHTKAIFSKYGIPKEIFSDNGPEFASREYKNFCQSWDIVHTTSSPEYPQSNGLAERTIQTVKRTLLKALEAEEDVHLALLSLKTTPLKNDSSPAKLFFNRELRNLIPSVNRSALSRNNNKQPPPVTNRIQSNETSGHALPELQTGDKVRIHTGKSWSRKGHVVKKATEPRSYHVQTNGNILRRNRRHLLKTNESFTSDSESDSSLIHEHDRSYIAHSAQTQSSKSQTESHSSTHTRYGRKINKPIKFSEYGTIE